MPTQADYRRLFEAAGELLACRSLATFGDAAMSAAGKVVSAECIAYNEIDTRQSRALALTDTPELAKILPDFERHIHEHPLVNYVTQTGDQRATKMSDVITLSAFRKLGLYADIFRPLGMRHQIVIGITTGEPLLIGVALNRGGKDFSERDRLMLNLLRPHLLAAWENAAELDRLRAALAREGRGAEASEPAIVRLDPVGRVRFASESARRIMNACFGKSESPLCLPDLLAGWLREQSDFASAAPLKIRGPDSDVIVRATTGPAPGERLLVFIEQPRQRGAEALQSLGLSVREAEVLWWIAAGHTNSQAGRQLGISPRTVHKHLEHIFQKLNVPNRVSAVVMAMRVMENGAKVGSSEIHTG